MFEFEAPLLDEVSLSEAGALPLSDLAPSIRVASSLGRELLVVSKSVAGFDRRHIVQLRRIIGEVASGHHGPVKFLVFDFAHGTAGEAVAGHGFDELVREASDLILEVPVVSIAWSRGLMADADLEFALGCSMMVGEDAARFSFAADIADSRSFYSFLAQKIGFVHAERLMEGGEVLGAAEMLNLLLLKKVVPPQSGLDGIEAFVSARQRRHNSSLGIYRAQRLAMRRI